MKTAHSILLHRISKLLCLVLLLLGQNRISAAEITKLLVFAESDRARIEGTASLSNLVGAELRGTIHHVGTGKALWSGSLGQLTPAPDGAQFKAVVSGVKPLIWEPSSPQLYLLNVQLMQGGAPVASRTARFGFRSMEIRNGQFHLNGHPIFLRGVAINPPGRTIPDTTAESRVFAEDYVRCLKAHNLNIFRISTDVSQTWFDVCDELGMMLYAGRYGSPPETAEGKQAAPLDFSRSIDGYRTLFENYVSHPSIVMYYLSNELPVSGKRGEEFSRLLTEAHAALRQWDPTRPYIGNAGYGEGREGEVCDVHRYWGWYYNSFLTYYNLRDRLRPQPLFGDPAKNQPLTFTECVGAFTGSSGEFNVVRSKQLGPRLGWIGHTETPFEDALEYQCFMVKQATEAFRRMRPLNPRLAGIMPFTILFYNWNGITNFSQMVPKPALRQMAISYQPVLLSWENWTPQRYASEPIKAVAHVINDQENRQALENLQLWWGLRDRNGRLVMEKTLRLPSVAYYGTLSESINIRAPLDLPTGDYQLCGSLLEHGRRISTNWTSLFIAGPEWREKPGALPSTAVLYDPSGKTARAWARLGGAKLKLIDLETATPKAPETAALIIGEDAWTMPLNNKTAGLRRYVEEGGRILVLKQDSAQFDPGWLPTRIAWLESSPNDTNYPPKTRPHREQMCVNPLRPQHPVFDGIGRERLRWWSDYTAWDQTRTGFPKIYPVTSGFRVLAAEDLAHTAVLADYDRGLEGVALCEMFAGKGSVLLSGFDLCPRSGLDPVADRLLRNLIRYTTSKAGHEAQPLVQKSIRWGDFPSEQGTMCGSLNGFLVNAEWLPSPVSPDAKPLAANTGAWNMKPGDQFVPRGRNPFGPYAYSTGSSLRSTDLTVDGTGTFWVRVPEGRMRMLTSVRNPGKDPGTLRVQINEADPVALVIPAGSTCETATSLPAGARSLRVSYTGPKGLVIEETRFE